MATIKYPRYQEPQVIHHVGLKKHHKIILGGFTTIVIIYMIVTAILLNGLIVKQSVNHNTLNNKIDGLQADTQSKLNELTETLIEQRTELNSLGSQIGDIDEQFASLKASSGEDFSGIIEEVVKGVVTVRTDVGQGTGFIIAEGGYFVTNAHVLSGASQVQAITYDQNSFKADFIGYDSDLDVALLKISGDYTILELADSDNIQLGEKVIAIGNPLGLQFSVSQGIVSGIHRLGPNDLEAYVQTDAALNPGNSGGPLINKNGEVIGINNFKIGSGESLGFALESNYIKEAVNGISAKALNQTLV
jgi:S1-C subfamily serine protease